MWLVYLQSFGTVHFIVYLWISFLVEFEVLQEGRKQWNKRSGKEHARGNSTEGEFHAVAMIDLYTWL